MNKRNYILCEKNIWSSVAYDVARGDAEGDERGGEAEASAVRL
jgi:hypothetical protein